MQLKKLQLLGFKTFADKTEIEIGTGLTAIVGPNGSGKSNIVDALLWVLGEQNPRLLRGASAQDVIFSGSDKRKPLGMAEVRLTVDNSDNTLPVRFAEVTVTRRVYRSGESQYLLNGSPCRLKDIVELFMDTGVGKGAYSFVSQQEIDSVLSARPEDRRELFEEAAGIKKYRTKKREALRKLESADANLNRVRDILNELEKQREPMEKQAMAARRYLLLQERLHEIEVGLLVAELQKADYELYAGQQERDADQSALLRIDADLTRLERAASETGERLAHTETELDAVRIARQNAFSQVERTESHLTLLTERSQTARKSQAQLTLEISDLTVRIENLKTRLAESQKQRVETEQAESEKRTDWAAQKGALSELEEAVRNAMREAEARQSERMRLAQERAGREAALRAAQERLEETRARSRKLTQEVEELSALLRDTGKRAEQAEKSCRQKQAERDSVAQRLSEREECRLQTLHAQNATRAALDSARRRQAEQSARLSTLTELQENHEGFYQGVRAVLNAQKRGHLTGHYRAVVDLLTVPESYRVAIEVALGGSLQDIVTHTEAEAKAGIAWLKQNRAGRATFLALPLLRPGGRVELNPGLQQQMKRETAVPGNLNTPKPQNPNTGDCVNAMDVLEFESEYANVVQLLLGRTLVAPDMDTAIALSRRLTGWGKIVTLEGELLTPGGALTGGSLQGRGAHLVGRKGEMDDLKAGLPAVREEVARLTEEAESQQRALQDLEAERSDLGRQQSLLASEIAAAISALASAEREGERLVRDRSERENACSQMITQAAALEDETTRLSQALEQGRAENVHSEDAYATLSEQTQSLAVQRDACRARTVALEVEVSRLREKREGLTRSVAGDRAALTSLEQQLLQKSVSREGAEVEGRDALAERERLEAVLEQARDLLLKVEGEVGQANARRQALLAESNSSSGAIKELIKRRSEITTSLHDTELRLARLEVQLAQVTERLQEEYSLSREEAVARPEDTTIDRNTAIEVSRLRRELRGMGQVNTGAVTEYERLTERFDFLTAQRADLESARESLLATIAEIDDSTRGVFMETFEAVQKEFERLFGRLFDGGSTKLILTKPQDILETGIEVIAQPPGKKPQHLSLLSGGERALTATALLFAFLAVKPSPFVLLDEVDAPLDGANVEKFTHLVREFSERSQFLLITHNPTTMEAAPAWYGVTMREPGISSILSYRVPQETIPTESENAVVLTNG